MSFSENENSERNGTYILCQVMVARTRWKIYSADYFESWLKTTMISDGWKWMYFDTGVSECHIIRLNKIMHLSKVRIRDAFSEAVRLFSCPVQQITEIVTTIWMRKTNLSQYLLSAPVVKPQDMKSLNNPENIEKHENFSGTIVAVSGALFIFVLMTLFIYWWV